MRILNLISYILGSKMRMILIALMLLQLLSFASADDLNAGSVSQGQACSAAGDIVTISSGNFGINWSNWRMYVVLGLIISAALVAILFMFARVIRDEGLMARSREEVLQLALTASLSIFFIIFAQFLCSSTILPSLIGIPQENLFNGAESYLRDMSSYTHNGFLTVFTFTSVLNWYESFSEKSGTINVITWGFAGGLKSLAPKALISMFLLAYLSANLHIYLLNFILLYCLMFLIPTGIVLRSFFPLRRFGGALLGAGITLSVIFPFLLLINSAVMGIYFHNPDFLNIDCASNYECMSKVCKPGSETGQNILGNICYPSLGVGEECDPIIGDWQCISGRCILPDVIESSAYTLGIVPEKVCAGSDALKAEGGGCTIDSDCLPSLWCNNLGAVPGTQGRCTSKFQLGSSCSQSNQCGTPSQAFCDNSHMCQSAKTIGDTCSENIECASLYCESAPGISGKACKEVKSDYKQLAIDISKSSTENVNILRKLNPLLMLDKVMRLVVVAMFGGVILPLINFMLLTRAMKDISGFFGSEIDIAGIYRIL